MRAMWETVEQVMALTAVGIVAIQISFMMELYVVAGLISALLTLSAGVLMLQFYIKKRR